MSNFKKDAWSYKIYRYQSFENFRMMQTIGNLQAIIEIGNYYMKVNNMAIILQAIKFLVTPKKIVEFLIIKTQLNNEKYLNI